MVTSRAVDATVAAHTLGTRDNRGRCNHQGMVRVDRGLAELGAAAADVTRRCCEAWILNLDLVL